MVRTRPFVALFAINLAMGFFFGGIGVAITAFTAAQGVPAMTGLIMAASGAVSLGAGLLYGATNDGRPTRLMLLASLIIVVGTAGLAMVPGVPAMFAGYCVVGGCVALVLIPASVLLHQVVHREVITQAMTWMNSASALGIAFSATLIGLVVQRSGWPAGFLVLSALTSSLPTVLLVARPTLNIRLQGNKET